VMFVEQDRQKGGQIVGAATQAILPADPEKQNELKGRQESLPHEDPFRWIFLSDVCKHCEEAGCLEACPTGAIVRTEFGGVFVQPDICNGCAYCIVSCPFGVVAKNEKDGRAFKCTFCYDRQKVGLKPACAQ